MNHKTLEIWRKKYMPLVYQCKRVSCIHSRPEGWEEIGHKKEAFKK